MSFSPRSAYSTPIRFRPQADLNAPARLPRSNDVADSTTPVPFRLESVSRNAPARASRAHDAAFMTPVPFRLSHTHVLAPARLPRPDDEDYAAAAAFVTPVPFRLSHVRMLGNNAPARLPRSDDDADAITTPVSFRLQPVSPGAPVKKGCLRPDVGGPLVMRHLI